MPDNLQDGLVFDYDVGGAGVSRDSPLVTRSRFLRSDPTPKKAYTCLESVPPTLVFLKTSCIPAKQYPACLHV